MLVLCHAQRVQISCSTSKADTELSCGYDSVAPSSERNVTLDVDFDVPGSHSKVVYIHLLHPSLGKFLGEVFDVFLNLQKIVIESDGSAILTSNTFRNAKNLVDFEVFNSMVANELGILAFDGATKLQRIAYSFITRIDATAFVGLSNLLNLSLEYSAWSDCCPIPYNVFYPLINLKEISLWYMHIKTIPATMFLKNTNLETIVIADSLLSVESTFIDHLPNLKVIRIYKAGSTGCLSADVNWVSPQPISQFHTAMAQCYANFNK